MKSIGFLRLKLDLPDTCKMDEQPNRFMTSDFVPPHFTLSYRGYEQDGLEISAVGQLKRHIGFWRHIRTSNFLLRTIDQGYRIPLVSCPPPHQAKNNASSRRQPEFVRRAINELIVTGAVQEV